MILSDDMMMSFYNRTVLELLAKINIGWAKTSGLRLELS